MTIGFILSAYFTLALATVHFLINRHQQRDPVDRAFLAPVVHKIMNPQTRVVSERWNRAFDGSSCFWMTRRSSRVWLSFLGYIYSYHVKSLRTPGELSPILHDSPCVRT